MKKIQKKEIVKFAIGILILALSFVIYFMNGQKLERQRELADIANLYAAKNTGIIELTKNQKLGEDNMVLWYNPQTESFGNIPAICGNGTNKKVRGVNYSDPKYTEFHYDGSNTTKKGIKVSFHGDKVEVKYETEIAGN